MRIIIIFAIVSILTTFLLSDRVFACTGIYVGKNISKNGSAFISRTEDLDSSHPKSIIVYPATEHKEGSFYKSAITGFKYPNPKRTYKYFAVPDSDGDNDDGTYDEVGFNEKGVAVTATVSADVNEKILAVDPLIYDGLREADIATLILSRTKSAREAVELLGKIIDEKGSAEGNIVMIADHKEIWYMEILSGHQYAAIKLPDDKAAIIPNCFMLEYVDLTDNDNVISSKDVIKLPEKYKILENKDGKFSLRKTYGPPLENYNKDRLWGGRYFLASSENIPYDFEYELFFKPDRKISLRDIMELQKYRYEDTKLNANLPENKTEDNKVRPIGTPNQHECHIIEIKDEFPKEAPGILWLCLGNSEHNVYLPYFPVLNKVEEEYSNRFHYFNENQAFWVFRAQATLAELNRDKYGKNIRNYWGKYQDQLIKRQESINKEFIKLYASDKNKAQEYANKSASELQRESYNRALNIYREILTYIAKEAGHPSEDSFMPEDMKSIN